MNIKSDFSVSKISQLMKEMEISLGLLSNQSFNQEARIVWEAARFPVSMLLQKSLLDSGEPHKTEGFITTKNPFKIVLTGVIRLGIAVFKSWLFAPRKKKWLVFQHSRRKKNELGLFEDIYTDEIIRNIGAANCVIIERPYGWRHSKPRPFNVWYDDLLFIIVRFLIKKKKIKLPSDVSEMADSVSTYLLNVTGVDVKSILVNQYKSVYYYRKAYRFMLSILAPEKILLVVSYGKEGLILAAREKNIETIELQHGVITDDHMGYAVNDGQTKLTFPDKILLFGEYWRNSLCWGSYKRNLEVFGFPYFYKEKGKYAAQHKRNQILFISQGTIGYKLSQVAVDLSNGTKNIEVVYKLHPGEVSNWKKDYIDLYNFSEQQKIKVVEGDNPALYQLMAESKWQIGVYSTALFEGLSFNCHTYLVNLPGIEYMSNLIKDEKVHLIESADEIDLIEDNFIDSHSEWAFFSAPNYKLLGVSNE